MPGPTARMWALLALLGGAAAENLFASGNYFVNPAYQDELQGSIDTCDDRATKNTLQQMMTVGSAYWIDKKEKINGKNDTRTLEGILEAARQQATRHKPSPLVVAIVYDLPNRDCAAHASNGEICCYTNEDGTCDYTGGSDCTDGIADYKNHYIDPYAEVLSEYADDVPIALIIEPDSMGNLVTNTGEPKCGNPATTSAYAEGVAYAITQIKSKCAKCELYLDSAHGGWLGWSNNLDDYVTQITSLDFEMSDLRGFATNVANYQPLGALCPEGLDCQQDDTDACCDDPCGLISEGNKANNELNYARILVDAFEGATGAQFHAIIDTGRNGQQTRSDCSNWCNIRGAGVGVLPTSKTANTSFIDAYYWLKTPGESDGCTELLPSASSPFVANGTCPRYDTMCGSPDSIGSASGEPYAPEAGSWFDFQIQQLAKNAVSWNDDDSGLFNDDDDDDDASADDGDDTTCVDDYAQCGGTNWDGSIYGPFTCCSGAECVHSSDSYWQCTP